MVGFCGKARKRFRLGMRKMEGGVRKNELGFRELLISSEESGNAN